MTMSDDEADKVRAALSEAVDELDLEGRDPEDALMQCFWHALGMHTMLRCIGSSDVEENLASFARMYARSWRGRVDQYATVIRDAGLGDRLQRELIARLVVVPPPGIDEVLDRLR